MEADPLAQDHVYPTGTTILRKKTLKALIHEDKGKAWEYFKILMVKKIEESRKQHIPKKMVQKLIAVVSCMANMKTKGVQGVVLDGQRHPRNYQLDGRVRLRRRRSRP